MKNLTYTSCIILISSLLIVSGCGRGDNRAASSDRGAESSGPVNSSTNNNSGYLDNKGWDQARGEIKTVEKVIETLNGFYDIWGWAYEHRVFNRYKEALETADHLPGKLEEVKKIADTIRPADNFPEIGNIKNCYMQMFPLLQGGAQDLKNSIIAARDKNTAEEKKSIQSYSEKWKAAMEHSKKSFALLQEVLTRGSRIEYTALTGAGKAAAYDPAVFRKSIKTITADYDRGIAAKIAAVKKLAAGRQWEVAAIKGEEVYSLLQKSIMKTGQVEPGNDKGSWNTRQELIATLSNSMMAMRKFSEYIDASGRGETQEAVKIMKIYEILDKSSADSRGRLKKLGY